MAVTELLTKLFYFEIDRYVMYSSFTTIIITRLRSILSVGKEKNCKNFSLVNLPQLKCQRQVLFRTVKNAITKIGFFISNS